MVQLVFQFASKNLTTSRHSYIFSCKYGDVTSRAGQVINTVRKAPERFTFVDLFSGIGGMRIPFGELGGACVFSCEWDKYAQATYVANFQELPHGDIRKIPTELVPEHDILLAGFPCQAFSIAGVSKKNALKRPHGFRDETQGTLFFEVKRVIAGKRPRAFLLENVKHLKNHDRGNTYRIIMRRL
jgi:DNA (cytosine-5)-methyltransferase 1